MPRTIYRERFAHLLSGELRSTFRNAGFRRSGNNFYRECPDAWQVINFQGNRWNTATEGSFTINIGIKLKSSDKSPRNHFPHEYECGRTRDRIGFFKDGKDYWWEIKNDADIYPTRNEIIGILEKNIFPFLNMFVSEEEIIRCLKEDACLLNDIYHGRSFFGAIIGICRKHGETDLGLKLIEDRQALLDLNDEQTEQDTRNRIWLESQKKDLLGVSITPADSIPGERNANDNAEKRYCTADPEAEIRKLVDWMTTVEKYSNSSDSLSRSAYEEAGKLVDERYIPVIKELILAEKKTGRRQALYTILGILGRNLQSSAVAAYLIERLPMETNKYVLQYMLMGIAEIPKGGNINMQAVIDLTDDKRWQVGLTVIEALNKEGDAAVEDKLIEVCSSDRDKYDLIKSNYNLGKIGTQRAIPALERHLKSRSRDVRGTAEAAIEAIRKRQKDGQT